MFASLQLAEALSYAALLGARVDLNEAAQNLERARSLSDFSRHSLAKGNLLCAEALLQFARGDAASALTTLAQAEAAYPETHSSGKQLVYVRRCLIGNGQ